MENHNMNMAKKDEDIMAKKVMANEEPLCEGGVACIQTSSDRGRDGKSTAANGGQYRSTPIRRENEAAVGFGEKGRLLNSRRESLWHLVNLQDGHKN